MYRSSSTATGQRAISKISSSFFVGFGSCAGTVHTPTHTHTHTHLAVVVEQVSVLVAAGPDLLPEDVLQPTLGELVVAAFTHGFGGRKQGILYTTYVVCGMGGTFLLLGKVYQERPTNIGVSLGAHTLSVTTLVAVSDGAGRRLG